MARPAARPQDDYDDDDDDSSSSSSEEDEEGLDGLRRIIGGRKKVDEESTQSSDMGRGRGGNRLMWTVEPLADDDLRSRHSLKMPEVPKPTEANLATRMDSFMQFLSYACGRPGLTLVMCFVMTPPPSCSELDQYMVFLHPIARAAIVETDTFIRSTSRDRLSIDDCIALRRGHYLLTSSTRLLGMHLRKALADNPIKMVPTEFASVKAQEDMNNALRPLIFDIERYCNLEPRGRDTFTSRVYGNKSFVQEEVDLNTEWMNVF